MGRTNPIRPRPRTWGVHRRVAVIGSGVSGLTAAWVMSKTADVTMFEADARLGGHADTHDVTLGGEPTPVDTGFIVHNQHTYPVLLRLFGELGVQTRDSEMSMSIRDDAAGIQWAGALGLRGVFPSGRMLVRPGHLRMLREIPRFHRMARRLVDAAPGEATDQTLADFLAAGGFSPHFRRHFMEPLVAAVWSCDPDLALDYPARYLFTFLQHHGMLRVFGSPQWKTVVGGSRTYVEQVGSAIADVRLGTKVIDVFETAAGVDVTDDAGSTGRFDAVVIATHPGQALDMLTAPTAKQQAVLGAMPYSTNHATLHSDDSVLPTLRRARASWNFLRRESSRDGLTVTYDLARLQGLPADRPVLLTLGGTDLIDADQIMERMEYAHPIYSPASIAAQRELPAINTPRVAFAGAYHGWGFHEDGARSGLAAAEHLGFSWGPRPGVFETVVRHTRQVPFRRTFTHRTHTWVVDVDDLPDHGRLSFALGRFAAKDHFGEPTATIRANVEAFLQRSGSALDGGRIVLATQPRAWGYCFNPISVFWCFDAVGTLAATIIEVHNTYGDRHAYLVSTDDHGDATTAKQMYVSPFHGGGGTYQIHAPVPGDRLDIGVALLTDDGAVFTASLAGEPSRLRAPVVRAALAALRGSVLIRMHGSWLWLRRLPIHPRPSHHQEGISA